MNTFGSTKITEPTRRVDTWLVGQGLEEIAQLPNRAQWSGLFGCELLTPSLAQPCVQRRLVGRCLATERLTFGFRENRLYPATHV